MRTIGVITKTYGFEGALVVRSESSIIREPKQGEPVFIVTDGIPVPFFTHEAFSPSPDSLVISFDDYTTPEAVRRFIGCTVMTAGENDDADPENDYTGYRVIDRKSGFKGLIHSVTVSHGHYLASVVTDNAEVLVPLHPDLITKTDKKSRVIYMSLPEGLTSLND